MIKIENTSGSEKDPTEITENLVAEVENNDDVGDKIETFLPLEEGEENKNSEDADVIDKKGPS